MKKGFLLVALLTSLGLPALCEPPKIKTIFDYKQELSLSDEQIQAMKSALIKLNGNLQNHQAKLKQLEAEFHTLIVQEASLEEAKAKLQQIAEATVAMRLTDFETSKSINATLTPEQKKKWRELQAKTRQQASSAPK